MNTNTDSTPTHAPPIPGDPRYAFAVVTAAVRDLMSQVEPGDVAKPTPCEDFDVKTLLEHLVLVMRRVDTIGAGGHWADITDEPVDQGWHDQFVTAAHSVATTWIDPAKLDAMYDVPWGEIPGGPLFIAYVGELAVHAWDLATALGLEVEIESDTLQLALDGAKFGIPAEIRNEPGVPFGPVVEVPEDAPLLDQLAGWFGRDIPQPS